MAKIPSIKLNDGHSMPRLGFGTFAWSEMEQHGGDFADVFNKSIFNALDAGYRHFDCAKLYGNQKALGKAFQKAFAEGKVKREDVFIISKIFNTDHAYEHAKAAIDEALADFGFDYIDLMFIHWPIAVEHKFSDDFMANNFLPATDVDYLETWKAMEEAVKAGKIRSIGLSNFNKTQVQRVIDNGTIKPAVLAIECHPYLNQTKFGAFCHEHGIILHSYWPFMNPSFLKGKVGNLFEEPAIKAIAAAHQKGPGQILLRWQIQRGNAVVAKSSNPKRMLENASIFDFALTDQEMHSINALDKGPAGRNNTIDNYKDNVHYPFHDEY